MGIILGARLLAEFGDARGRYASAKARKNYVGACSYYDRLRARSLEHRAALRQLANRLVGILHGCLETRTSYNETTAWPADIAAAATPA